MKRLDWLRAVMAEAPDRPFIVWRDTPYPYGWLVDRIDRWAERLRVEGIGAGSVVAIEGDYSPDVVALLIALIDTAAIVVPLTDSVEAQKAEFRAIAEVGVAIVFDGAGRERFEHVDCEAKNPLTVALRERGQPGLVLFSSGSTGKSKAALHDFGALLEKFQVRRKTFTTLTFLLLDHIGGINTLLYTLANAGTIVAIDDRRPDAVCAAIERHRVHLLPTSPTFINLLLLSRAYERYDLSSLERVTYGTEVMPQATLERIHEILPGVDLQQTYGLSELGILRTKSREPNSLWVKVGGEGFQTRIVDGVLHIKARSAMLGYLNAPSPFDADGWFNTQDAVEVDGEYIKILGRTSELINVGGLKVYPAEVESVILGLDGVVDVTVVGEKNPIVGNVVVARCNLREPEPLPSFRARLRAHCRERLPGYKVPSVVKIVDDEQFSLRYKRMRKAEA